MKTLKKMTMIICAALCFALVSNAQQGKEIVLTEIKPTLTGYKNQASVQTEKVGQNKKAMTVFHSRGTLVARKGGEVWSDGEFTYDVAEGGWKWFTGDVHIAIDGDTQFTGNLDLNESTYTFVGTVRLVKHIFSSDEKAPLVFKLVKKKGFVYLKGKGKVTLPDGKAITIP